MSKLRFAGLVESTLADPERFKGFRNGFQRMQLGEHFEPDEKNKYQEEISALQKYVLSHADVVVTTLCNCGEAVVYESVKPTVIAIDGAARASEPELWNVLAHYYPLAIVLAGDEKQLGPTVLSDIREEMSNDLARQLSISLFTRFLLNSATTEMLTVQHRSAPMIRRLFSDLSYDGKSENATPVHKSATKASVIAWHRRSLSSACYEKAPIQILAAPSGCRHSHVATVSPPTVFQVASKKQPR